MDITVLKMEITYILLVKTLLLNADVLKKERERRCICGLRGVSLWKHCHLLPHRPNLKKKKSKSAKVILSNSGAVE